MDVSTCVSASSCNSRVFSNYRVSILTFLPNPAITKLIKKYGGTVVINPTIADANGPTSIALADPSLLHRISPQLLSAFGTRVYSPSSISECVRQHSIARLDEFRISGSKQMDNGGNDTGVNMVSSPTPTAAAPASSPLINSIKSASKFTSPLAVTHPQPLTTTATQRKRKLSKDEGESSSPMDPSNSTQESPDSSSRSKDIEAAVKHLEASGFSRLLIVHALLVTSGDMKLARAYLSNQLAEDVHLWGPQEDLALNGHDVALTKQLVQRIGKLETAKRVKFLHSA